MKREFYILLILLILGLIGSAVYSKSQQKKIAFVKIGELYNDFEMKKELERSLISISNSRKNILDSMELELKLIDKKIQTNSASDANLKDLFESKRENYFLKKNQFQEDNNQMQEQYTANIMKQLNQYVADYGRENEYWYIFGAEGSGALMYADSKEEITKEVGKYINEKYKGLKK
jgi:outer membrane protein